VARRKAAAPSVFINCPFDPRYERLFVALISTLTALGLVPRSVLQVHGTTDRLRRLYGLIRECEVSVHDLSYVRLSTTRPRVPRFNMPFELGLAAAAGLAGARHRWFVLERQPYRLQVSLSDVNGYDPYIHRGTPAGMIEAIANVFSKPGEPAMRLLHDQFAALESVARNLKRRERHSTLFAPRPFRGLVLAGMRLATRSLA
jgi:hypothetical protein